MDWGMGDVSVINEIPGMAWFKQTQIRVTVLCLCEHAC